MAFFDVQYTNTGTSKLAIKSWTNNAHTVNAQRGASSPAFWSYQSGSYERRPNWILPLHAKFQQENYQGMNASDYGGGTPIVDVWRRDVGIAVGHVETTPRLVSLPVAMASASEATVAVRARGRWTLDPGKSFDTLRTFVAVHRGDHFAALVDYRGMMERQGRVMNKAPASAFEPIWCAWGYGRDFTVDQVIGTLPVAKRLGLRQEGARHLGLRRAEDRRPAPQRRAALLEPRARACLARGRGHRRARFLPGDLGCGSRGEARRGRRDLPLRDRVLLLHPALPQHDGRFRPGKLLAGAPEGQDVEGAPRRWGGVLRRSSRADRRRRGIRVDGRHRRRDRDQLRVAGRARQEGPEAAAHSRPREALEGVGRRLPGQTPARGRVPG